MNFGAMTLIGCTISGNYATGGGGGLFNDTIQPVGPVDARYDRLYDQRQLRLRSAGACTMTTERRSLYACTIAGNTASTSGGGVYNIGTLVLADTTISGNSAPQGGGLSNFGEATLDFCTVASNSASVEAGGLFNGGTATLTDTIVASNRIGGLRQRYRGHDRGCRHRHVQLDRLGRIGGHPGWDGGQHRPDRPLGAGAGAAGRLRWADPDHGPVRRQCRHRGWHGVDGITVDQRGLPLDSPVPDIGAYQSQPGQPFYPTPPFLVTSTADDGSVGTLRWAVYWADRATSPSTIEFNLGYYWASTITLTHGPLDLSNSLEPITIDGPGANLLTISGNDASRVFQVTRA